MVIHFIFKQHYIEWILFDHTDNNIKQNKSIQAKLVQANPQLPCHGMLLPLEVPILTMYVLLLLLITFPDFFSKHLIIFMAYIKLLKSPIKRVKSSEYWDTFIFISCMCLYPSTHVVVPQHIGKRYRVIRDNPVYSLLIIIPYQGDSCLFQPWRKSVQLLKKFNYITEIVTKIIYSTDIQFLRQSTGRLLEPGCTNTHG